MKIKYWLIVVSLVCLSGCTYEAYNAVKPEPNGSDFMKSIFQFQALNAIVAQQKENAYQQCLSNYGDGYSTNVITTSTCCFSANDMILYNGSLVGSKSTRVYSVSLSSGSISTLAGSSSGYYDYYNLSSKFQNPGFLTQSSANGIAVTDYNTIRKITDSGGVNSCCVNTIANTATTVYGGITYDLTGNNLYYTSSNLIYKVTNGAVTVYAGSAGVGDLDGTLTTAKFSAYLGKIVINSKGNLFVIDGQKIKQINTTSGKVTTFFTLTNAISGFTIDSSDNFYGVVVDTSNRPYNIIKITADGSTTSFISGTGKGGDGIFDKANTYYNGFSSRYIYTPVVDTDGSIYAVYYDCRQGSGSCTYNIVKFNKLSTCAGSVTGTGTTTGTGTGSGTGTTTGTGSGTGTGTTSQVCTVTTFAGSGTSGSTDGTGTAASFNYPYGLGLDSSGNIFVADFGNNKIRKITSTGVVTTFAGSGSIGSTDATGTAASFNGPIGIGLDSSGNLFVGDSFNNKIRKITSAGVVTTFAGSGSAGSTDATGTSASFTWPSGIALDSSGNVYVADPNGNHKIRKITSAGVVTTFAGSTGTTGSTDATGTAASFFWPRGVVVDSTGNLFVGDNFNHKIRKITSAGVVTTFAGSGSASSTDATGTSASFNYPYGLGLDSSGNIFVADSGNNKIRKITSGGIVSTIAGSGSNGSTDATGTAASFNYPVGIVVDTSGTIYVVDTNNHKIRKIVCQ
jgi:ATP-dependent protease HslVU (ClpYQ) peptidase subunit